jgi:hypothetical protein
MRGFLKEVFLFGLASLIFLVPWQWFLILPVVVYGGAFVGDLFEGFGNATATVASYSGLLLTTAIVLASLGAVGGLILATLFRLGRFVLRRLRPTEAG